VKVLWITPGFAADESDSTCIPPLQDLVRALQKQNIELTIVALDYPFNRIKYHWHGIRVYALGGGNKKGLSRLFLLQRTWRLLRNLEENHEVDLVHSFWLTWPAVVGQRFCKKYKLPHLQTIMGQDAMKNKFYSWFDFKYSAIVNLSQFANDKFNLSAGRQSDAIIPFGLGWINAEVVERDIDLINVGSVTGLKNQLLFLKLVKQIQQLKFNVKAVLIGKFYDLHLIRKLKQFIAENHLEGIVELLEEMPRTEMFKYLGRAKVMIHTSTFESQGMVMLEAIAHGCKVYSSGKGMHFNHELFSLLTDDLNENVNSIFSYLLKKKNPHGEKIVIIEQTANDYLDLYKKLLKK